MSFYSPDQVTSKNFSSIWVKWSEVKVSQSCPTLQPHGLHRPWNSPGQNTGVGICSLLQGIFPPQGLNLELQVDSLPAEPQGKPKGIFRIQESNQGLPHCSGFFTDWELSGKLINLDTVLQIKLMQKLYKVPEVGLEIQETVLEIHSTNAECLLCAVTLLCDTQALKIH